MPSSAVRPVIARRSPRRSPACAPYLKRQIALIQPRLIVLLGRAAAHALLGDVGSLASLRGQSFAYPAPAGSAVEFRWS
jgi:uracil-DNA glycosylase family 4